MYIHCYTKTSITETLIFFSAVIYIYEFDSRPNVRVLTTEEHNMRVAYVHIKGNIETFTGRRRGVLAFKSCGLKV